MVGPGARTRIQEILAKTAGRISPSLGWGGRRRLRRALKTPFILAIPWGFRILLGDGTLQPGHGNGPAMTALGDGSPKSRRLAVAARLTAIGSVLCLCSFLSGRVAAQPPAAFTPWQDAVLYFVMIDRWADGDATNNAVDIGAKGTFHGGDLKGLRAAPRRDRRAGGHGDLDHAGREERRRIRHRRRLPRLGLSRLLGGRLLRVSIRASAPRRT